MLRCTPTTSSAWRSTVKNNHGILRQFKRLSFGINITLIEVLLKGDLPLLSAHQTNKKYLKREAPPSAIALSTLAAWQRRIFKRIKLNWRGREKQNLERQTKHSYYSCLLSAIASYFTKYKRLIENANPLTLNFTKSKKTFIHAILGTVTERPISSLQPCYPEGVRGKRQRNRGLNKTLKFTPKPRVIAEKNESTFFGLYNTMSPLLTRFRNYDL